MELIAANLRHPKVNALLCDHINVELWMTLLKDSLTADSTSFGSSPIITVPALYHILRRWIGTPKCRTTLAKSSVHLEFFISHTCGLKLTPDTAEHFTMLWISVLEPMVKHMDLKTAVSVLSTLGNGPSKQSSSMMGKLYVSKVEQAIAEARKSGKALLIDTSMIFVKAASSVLSSTTPLVMSSNVAIDTLRASCSSETLKLWTYLWRSGCDQFHIFFALDERLRKTDYLANTLPPVAFKLFQCESDYKQNPNCSWMFLSNRDPLMHSAKPTSSQPSSTSPSSPSSSGKSDLLDEFYEFMAPISAATSSATDFSSNQNPSTPSRKFHSSASPSSSSSSSSMSTSLKRVLDTMSRYGSVEKDDLVAEHRARLFRQAEFIAHVCHTGKDKPAYFFPHAKLLHAATPQNWEVNDPLLKLLACGFRSWDKLGNQYVSTMKLCKRYATLVVKDVVARRAFLEVEHPLVILAVLQTGVLNSHLAYEYQLYPSLYAIFEQRKPERERAAAVVRDMARCAARHPSELCLSVPVLTVIEFCMSSGHPAMIGAAMMLLAAVSNEPAITSPFDKNTPFLQSLLDSLSVLVDHKTKDPKALALYTLWQFGGRRILDRTFFAAALQLFELCLPSLTHLCGRTSICEAIVSEWMEDEALYELMMTPEVARRFKTEHIDLLPRHLPSMLITALEQDPSTYLPWCLKLASGRDEQDEEVNNASLIARTALIVSNFPSDDWRRRSLLRLGLDHSIEQSPSLASALDPLTSSFSPSSSPPLHRPSSSSLSSSLLFSSPLLPNAGSGWFSSLISLELPDSSPLRCLLNSVNQWQHFHKLAGLVDLSVIMANLCDIALEECGEKEWKELVSLWALHIKLSGKHHPIFEAAAAKLAYSLKGSPYGMTIDWKFKPSEIPFDAPLGGPLHLSPLNGRVLEGPMNTIFACVHKRPVHVVVETPVELEALVAKSREGLIVSGLVEPSAQILPRLRIGVATTTAIDALHRNPTKRLGQVPGSYSVEHLSGTILANGACIPTERTRSLSSTRAFSININVEHQIITVAFGAERDLGAPYVIWNVDFSAPLYPVISFESNGCVVLDHNWVDTPFTTPEDEMWKYKPQQSSSKAPPAPPQQNEDFFRIQEALRQQLEATVDDLPHEHVNVTRMLRGG